MMRFLKNAEGKGGARDAPLSRLGLLVLLLVFRLIGPDRDIESSGLESVERDIFDAAAVAVAFVILPESADPGGLSAAAIGVVPDDESRKFLALCHFSISCV